MIFFAIPPATTGPPSNMEPMTVIMFFFFILTPCCLSEYAQKKTYPIYTTQEVRQYPERSCKQSTSVLTDALQANKINPLVLWRFPEFDPLEKCELYDFQIFVITVLFFTSHFQFGK